LLIFNDDLVVLDLDAPDARGVIEVLADKLAERSYVSGDYGQHTFAREQEHPTGLPTKPFCIAFPHADAEGVYHSALAMASLHKPVLFKNMGDPEEELSVHLVFMLANRDPEEQVQTLRNLARLFGQPEKLVALRAQSTPAGAAAWLRRELGLS
jgi:PTS system galactitol-specific IIA component